MNERRWRLIARPGSGALGRFADVVLFIARADDPAAAELLEVARNSEAAMVIEDLFDVVRAHRPAQVASFCCVVASGDDPRVAIHGEIEVLVAGAGAPLKVSGRDANSRVEESLPGGEVAVAGGEKRAKLDDDPLFDLVAGVVPAGSFQLTSKAPAKVHVAAKVAAPADQLAPPAEERAQVVKAAEDAEPATIEPAPAPPPVIQPAEPVPAQAQPAVAPEPAVPEATPAPAPATAPPPKPIPPQPTIMGAPPPPEIAAAEIRHAATMAMPAVGPAPAHAEAPEVEGRLCLSGHLNNPNAAACWICGGQLGGETGKGPRPPLGRLTTKDQRSYVIDGDFVLGRKPDQAEDVQAGRARGIDIPATEGGASRVHAEIRLDGWNVLVKDLNSTNGTFYLPPGAPEWVRVPPGGAAGISPGTIVTIGGFELLFEEV